MSDIHEAQRREHVTALLPDVVLGLATREERGIVDRHVASCDGCRRELEAYREVAANLTSDAELPKPPSALWERIQAEIRRPEAAGEAAARPQRRIPWSAAAAVALVAGFAAMVGGVIGNQLGNDDPDLGPLDEIATDDWVFTLAPSNPADEATGRIFMSADRTRGVVAVTGLAPLPDEESYAVWLVKSDDTRENIGTFTVDEAGASIAPLSLPYTGGDWDERDSTFVALSISRIDRSNPSVPVGGAVMVGPIY